MNSIIYTITPNPALDLGGVVDDIIPNEKNYVHDETRFPGGNSINAARVLTRLKVPTVASGFLGGGVGSEVERLLHREGVITAFVPIANDTRVSITAQNRKSNLQTRLSYHGPLIAKMEKDALRAALTSFPSPAVVTIGGSLPPGFKPNDLRGLITLCKRRQIPCFVDVPGPILKEVISAGPTFIKPNLTEFQELIGKRLNSLESVVFEAKKLSRFIPIICVSSVDNGAIVVTRGGCWHGKLPRIKNKTTVGAGDSMVGAMIASWWWASERKEEPSPDDLLRWGLAGAWATLLHPGTVLGSGDEIRGFVARIPVKRIAENGSR